ncbi:unnamed protein product [Tetraodon nigroviridis]|uniref:(spotted green pufferfish) hypothetical protein n=1 Tax=Tetraodon nigroviridis TaxID=99883 RepID=Q4SRD6_TETNG|nr:unnamed protein product [Tetraodon nigroviridis]
MAPNQKAVELQTEEIFSHLLEDKPIVYQGPFSAVETDSPAGSDDEFNAVLIAAKLKAIADSLNDNVVFKEALEEFKIEAAKGAIEAAFSHTVKNACRAQASQCPGLSPELQLLKTTATFACLVANSCPSLRGTIFGPTIAFINRNLGDWITQQGGWGRINI